MAYLSTGTKLQFVLAKARVAPLKEITLPRLELMAIVLASRMLSYLADQLSDVEIKEKVIFSDSSVALSWVNSTKKLDKFVQSRVKEIHDRTAHVKFNHVKGTLNPADVISRGVSVRTLKSNDIWLTGPSYLIPKEPSIVNASQLPVLDLPEQTVESSNVVSKEILPDITRYSTLSKLENVVARVLMFCNVLR